MIIALHEFTKVKWEFRGVVALLRCCVVALLRCVIQQNLARSMQALESQRRLDLSIYIIGSCGGWQLVSWGEKAGLT